MVNLEKVHKYRYSIKNILQNIPIFWWVIFFVSFIEIICLWFNIGFPILNEQQTIIVTSICLSFLSSCIFYFFVEILPSVKKKYIYAGIIYRNILGLEIECLKLKYLVGYKKNINNSFEKSKINSSKLFKKLKSGNNWKKNIKRLKSATNKLIGTIEKISRYESFIDDKYLYSYDYIITELKELEFEKRHYNINEEFVESASKTYEEIINRIELLVKEHKLEYQSGCTNIKIFKQ